MIDDGKKRKEAKERGGWGKMQMIMKKRRKQSKSSIQWPFRMSDRVTENLPPCRACNVGCHSGTPLQ